VASGFVVWEGSYKEGFCVITSPEGTKHRGTLLKGIALADQWTDDVVCRMDPDYPKDIQLSDNLYGSSYLIVSRQLKESLVALTGSSNMEFLPVSILNHKDRVVSDEYYILNVLDKFDCIDQAKSVVEWSEINPNAISSCDALILKEDVLPENAVIFRPQFLLSTILVKREIATKLLASGLTGLAFLEPSKYTG
jgi:hypothetical protein